MRIREGGQISASSFNEQIRRLEQAQNLVGGGGIGVSRGSTGYLLGPQPRPAFWAKITGTTSGGGAAIHPAAYSWIFATAEQTGTFNYTTQPVTGTVDHFPAVEVDGYTDVEVGVVVLLTLSDTGDFYWFTRPGASCCNKVPGGPGGGGPPIGGPPPGGGGGGGQFFCKCGPWAGGCWSDDMADGGRASFRRTLTCTNGFQTTYTVEYSCLGGYSGGTNQGSWWTANTYQEARSKYIESMGSVASCADFPPESAFTGCCGNGTPPIPPPSPSPLPKPSPAPIPPPLPGPIPGPIPAPNPIPGPAPFPWPVPNPFPGPINNPGPGLPVPGLGCCLQWVQDGTGRRRCLVRGRVDANGICRPLLVHDPIGGRINNWAGDGEGGLPDTTGIADGKVIMMVSGLPAWATASGTIWTETSGTTTTTDATTTTALTIALDDNTVTDIEFQVVGRRTGGGGAADDLAAFTFRDTFQRNGAGAPTRGSSGAGTPSTIYSRTVPMSTVTATTNISGNNAICEVTGADGVDYSWTVYARYIKRT